MPINRNAGGRYLVIDSCLINSLRKYPTLTYLKNKIDEKMQVSISESMITKDIQDMKRLYKAPIYFNRQHRGYEYTTDKFSIKKIPLTEDEIDALNYSTLFLNKLKGSDLYTDIESAINKVISDSLVNNIVKKSNKKILQPEEPVNTEGNKWMVTLLYAITNQECLEITYKSYQRDESKHIFSAYMLKENRKRWYVIGYNHKLNKILSLGLDRITSIQMSAIKYFRKPGFSEEDYFKYCLGIMKDENAKPEKVQLQFNAFQSDYVLSQPLHKSQKIIEQTKEKLIIEFEVYVTHEVIQTILAYGEQVKVLEPTRLREEIKNNLNNTSKNYK